MIQIDYFLQHSHKHTDYDNSNDKIQRKGLSKSRINKWTEYKITIISQSSKEITSCKKVNNIASTKFKYKETA